MHCNFRIALNLLLIVSNPRSVDSLWRILQRSKMEELFFDFRRCFKVNLVEKGLPKENEKQLELDTHTFKNQVTT